MVASIQQQLDYASIDAARGRRRVPRGVAVMATALGLTYVVFLGIAAATDPQPARAALFLAHENAYAGLITGASLVAYFGLRRHDASQARRTSFLALFSTLVAVLNPAVVGLLFGAVGVQGIGGGGDSEMYSFFGGVVALTAGIIAARRIRRSHNLMSGMRLATAGIVVGALWLGFWIALALVFAIGMSAF